MAGPELVTVHLVGVPVRSFLAAHHHYDDVLREIALVALDANRRELGLSRELVDRVEQIRSLRNSRVDVFHQQVLEAAARGDDLVDLDLETPLLGVELTTELADLQDQLDAHCRAGELISLEAPPEVKTFRRHLADEIRRQARDGLPPRPFPR